MANLMVEMGSVIIAATLLAYFTRLIRQPMVLGYIAAGFIIGPYVAGLITSSETIALLSELGIAFVLFIVGLEIDFKRIRDCGVNAGIIGTGQVVFTSVVGFMIAAFFGFTSMESFYIAVALAFSSTMIVIKLLSDKGVLDTLHGRLILGVLLIQDVIAIFVLALLPNLSQSSLQLIALSLAKGVLIFAAAFVAAKTILPAIFNISARSTELLFLSAVSWLFAFAFFAEFLGYSIAIGAFVAGVTLASSSYKLEVVSRVKSLRDFFATVFFVSLGMQLVLPSLGSMLIPVIVFSLFVIIGNPIIVAVLGMALGYNKRISIMTGLPIGQVSEFSLIVVALGVSLGHISGNIASLIVAVASITITSTTYVIKHDEMVYRFLKGLFNFSSVGATERLPRSRFDVVLCGYNRIGYSIANKLKDIGKSFLVVDFNPEVVAKLKKEKIPCVYGDLGDAEFVKKLNIPEAELVISTVPTFYENEMLINEAKKGRAIAIVTSNQVDTALKLYDAGAHYVILPHFLGGEYVAMLLEKSAHLPSMMQYKFSHIKHLHQRKLMGHDHPL
ncbi:cation:proton antiporter [Candidatus Woesearchaeota archaeon]|nr:cation:proton antiporter [Candidatus Woesearchaeota archaeon]